MPMLSRGAWKGCHIILRSLHCQRSVQTRMYNWEYLLLPVPSGRKPASILQHSS